MTYIMQVVAWIIIILAVVFLIWLFKRWIKRIIFILILLILAFLIYGIFNPSGAAKLWYNVRTFPQRMAVWMGSGEEFLDYNTYKEKISSIGDDISEAVDTLGDNIDLSVDGSSDETIDSGEEKNEYDKNNLDEERELDGEDENPDSNTEENVIKSFPKGVKFVEMPKLRQEIISENVGLSGYSRTDLLGVINRYLEKNLDDDTDILVTVEYEEDSADPQKIILKTQSKTEHSVLNSDNLVDEVFPDSDKMIPQEIEIIPSEDASLKSENSQLTQEQLVQKQEPKTENYASNKLTEKEQKEAEEIFGILF